MIQEILLSSDHNSILALILAPAMLSYLEMAVLLLGKDKHNGYNQFSNKLLWVNRAGIQLADGPVIPSQQFGLGGPNNVRGYRESFVTRDNGMSLSTELRIPLFSGKAGDSSTCALW